MTETPLSRVQLAEIYSDTGWQQKLLDLLSLVAILRDSIIDRGYQPSEELVDAVILSEMGRKLQLQIAKESLSSQKDKDKVNPNDAKILCLLSLVHIEPLVDIEKIDIERLTAAISIEVRSGRIRHPFVFGRDLYDRSAALFKEEREYLNHEDTVRLLEGTPQGVFHTGNFLSGPFGVVRTEHYRSIGADTAAPIQHCADVGCARVHRVQLTTSIEAGVNRSRSVVNRLLNAISIEPSEWNGFVSDISEGRFNPYEIDGEGTLPQLLGDCFSEEELRTLILHSESHLEGSIYPHLKKLNITETPKQLADSFDRAQMLNVLLMWTDSELTDLIDSAIREGKVRIPDGEIRLPRVNRSSHPGAWHMRSQVSRLGVRSMSDVHALPLMRISTIAESMLKSDSMEEIDDLAWMIAETNGLTVSDKLQNFLRVTEPAEVIEKLILSRRSTATKTAENFGIPIDQPKSFLRDALLWKMGFPLQRTPDIRDEYWRLHERLEAFAKTANVDLNTTASDMRSGASDYFVTLEEFLFDSLCFATWALTNDHYQDERPFTYLPAKAREFAIDRLNAESNGGSSEQNNLSLRPKLQQLVQGFVRLGSYLSKIRETPDSNLRAPEDYPGFAAKTDLQRFPFIHNLPFLDLTAESQAHLISVISSVANELNSSGIMTSRNGLLHAADAIPTVGEVTESLKRARAALDQLEEIGCVRSTFTRSTTAVDQWGRSTVTLQSNGKSIAFFSPSPFEWAKLPTFSSPQYLMQGAVFAAPNEMLRFFEGFESEYHKYWVNFPVRPERGNRIAASQAESRSTGADTGSYAASRPG